MLCTPIDPLIYYDIVILLSWLREHEGIAQEIEKFLELRSERSQDEEENESDECDEERSRSDLRDKKNN